MSGPLVYEPYVFGVLFAFCCFYILSAAAEHEWDFLELVFAAGIVALLGTVGISCMGRLIAVVVFAWQRL